MTDINGQVVLAVRGFGKTFTLHDRNTTIPVLSGVTLEVGQGECVALDGPSGSGKSSLMRAIHANYVVSRGMILVRHNGALIDMATAEPRTVLDIRRQTISYVSQFLRVLPRISTLEIVAEPLIALGWDRDTAFGRASALLKRMNLSEKLWGLSPTTFSGGEQQRVNLARGLIHALPILLVDEPTAALDRYHRSIVVDLLQEALARGAAVIGIFHDREVREAVATRVFDVAAYKPEPSRATAGAAEGVTSHTS